MTVKEYKQFSDLFEPDLLQALDPEHCVNARVSYGAPGYEQNIRQLAEGEKRLQEQEQQLKAYWENL